MSIETGETVEKKTKKGKKKVNEQTGEITEDFLPENPEVQENSSFPGKPLEEESVQVDPDGSFYRISFLKMQVVTKRDSTERSLDVMVNSHISEFKTGYWFVMVFNEKPYDDRISSVIREKAEFEAQSQMDMFNEAKEKELKRFDDQIASIRDEREMAREKCPEIKFYGSVLNIDSSRSYPVFTVVILDTVVNKLNDAWPVIRKYKVQLQ